jgi:uncharacterized protein (DUF58 family)
VTSPAATETVPLYPRRRLLGSASGGATSIRRGGRADVASSRPYRPGDHVRSIDWKASARLSSARDSDEFIVRERHVDEMPAVVLVVDRRPAMALYPADLPWLQKPAALRAVSDILVASAFNQRSLVAYLDYATHLGESSAGAPYWRPPHAHATVWSRGLQERVDTYLTESFDAPSDNVALALDFLSTRRSAVPIGSFVFVLSDFAEETPSEAWTRTIAYGWDVVPVIVQDPVWEQSFPAIDGVLVTLADAPAGRSGRVRLSAAEVADRRHEHEERLKRIRTDFARIGLDAILVGSSEPAVVHGILLDWAHARLDLLRGPR